MYREKHMHTSILRPSTTVPLEKNNKKYKKYVNMVFSNSIR